MCAQLDVLKKIRDKGKVNGYDVELAEAQAKDFIMMNKKVGNIEKDVMSIKREQKKQGEMLAKQGGQIDLIVNRMNSPVDEERKNGIIWNEIKHIARTPSGRLFILLVVCSFCLAGSRVLELLGLIKPLMN